MDPYKLYIQQNAYNGITYSRGVIADTLDKWKIVCAESPYRIFGDPKDVATREWLDEHGKDMYIPSDVKFKSFDADFTFLCTGSNNEVRANMEDFLRFLSGKSSGAASRTVGAWLVVYDTYNKIGWKDVRFKSVSSDALLMYDTNDVVLKFKVTFEVNDPYTKIDLTYNNKTPQLTWQS